ncbi:MAG: hypothetical protein MZW92_01620 [Comamonadaceae bacterium]|nr:hypothetical protein [Comamonadaceae bacterium]
MRAGGLVGSAIGAAAVIVDLYDRGVDDLAIQAERLRLAQVTATSQGLSDLGAFRRQELSQAVIVGGPDDATTSPSVASSTHSAPSPRAATGRAPSG